MIDFEKIKNKNNIEISIAQLDELKNIYENMDKVIIENHCYYGTEKTETFQIKTKDDSVLLLKEKYENIIKKKVEIIKKTFHEKETLKKIVEKLESMTIKEFKKFKKEQIDELNKKIRNYCF